MAVTEQINEIIEKLPVAAQQEVLEFAEFISGMSEALAENGRGANCLYIRR
jgi:Ca2+-binding EF-hand superfamily protein